MDSRLLKIARHKVVSAANRVGISLKQTYAKKGKQLLRKAGGYAHAKQFRRLKSTVSRQRTIHGVVMHEVRRKLQTPGFAVQSALAASCLTMWLERAERITPGASTTITSPTPCTRRRSNASEKCKAHKPYEFRVKNAVVISHKAGLSLGARSFPGNPYDGHILKAALEQAMTITQNVNVTIREVAADLGFRGLDSDYPDKQIIHRGRYKKRTPQQKAWLRQRQAVELAIGYLKSDHRLNRCWLQGALDDALHEISCAAGYNPRWLLCAIARLNIGPAFMPAAMGALSSKRADAASNRRSQRLRTRTQGQLLDCVVAHDCRLRI